MKNEEPNIRLNSIMPIFDFTEDSEAVIRTAPEAAYQAIQEFTMAEMSPIVRLLAFLRTFPEKLAGRNFTSNNIYEPYLPQECRDFFTELSARAPYEYITGLIVPGDIGRLWKRSSEINFRPANLEEYSACTDPAYVKVTMGILIEESNEPGSIKLKAEWRIHALSREAKKRFTPYWRVIGPFSHFIQKSMVKAIKKRAEKSADLLDKGVIYASR